MQIKKVLSLALLLTSFAAVADSCGSCCGGYGSCVAPYYSVRSQSCNAALELAGAGWNTQINLCNQCERYGNLSIAAEYTKSFKANRICDCLFGCTSSGSSCGPCNTSCNPCNTSCGTSCGPCRPNNGCDNDCCRIGISGSQVANRGTCDWLADYFGLPTDYQSVVTFKPRIENFLVDFNLYLGLDEWCQGMYFRIHAPIVHTRRNLNMCESGCSTGTNCHMAGYFNKTITECDTQTCGICRENLVSNFTSFISGCGVINSRDVTFNPLCYAKMDCCRHKETALADIRMALGWNFRCDENCGKDYHVGLGLYAAVPTGSRPEGCYLFEPIVGNGKHWELGGQLTSHYTFWRDECEERSAALYIDANITHLFKSHQCRTFDLCGKPLSRYMLASKFKTPVEDLQASDTDPAAANVAKPVKQFAGIYSPVANLTTMPVDVSVGVQGDLAIMLQYNYCNWSFDLGYNFWARSCEKIDCRCDCCPCFEDNTWALKGDAVMYGFLTDPVESPGIALSATQSKATICAGTNNYPDGDTTAGIPYYANSGVDNRKLSWDNSSGADIVYSILPDGEADQVYTSKEPVFIKLSDLDFCGARTKGRSHKIFGALDYTWCDRCDNYTPYLGIGFEAEFGSKCCDDSCNNNCGPCNTSCNPCDTSSNCGSCCTTGCAPCCDNSCCSTCAVSQWGIFVKGGLAF